MRIGGAAVAQLHSTGKNARESSRGVHNISLASGR